MRAIAGIALRSFAAFAGLLACDASPPRACQAYLDCFHGAGQSPYEGDPDLADLAAPDARRAALDAYGAGGECWRFGPDDPLWATCERACLESVVDACQGYALGEGGTCVTEATPGESRFGGGGSSLTCSEADEALRAVAHTPG